MTCPTRDELQELLADSLSSDQVALLVEHVESCSRCHAVLDELTGVPEQLRAPNASPEEGPGAEFLNRLVQAGYDTQGLGEDPTAGGASDDPSAAGRETARVPEISGFEVLGKLGHGGMGVVYLARQTRLDRQVALKMLAAPGPIGERQLHRLRTETQAVARLHHPNIVQIYEVGGDDRQPYIALEYVAGGTLAERSNGTPQPIRQSAELCAKLADAVEHAHRQGVVHRDIKPGNILLTSEGEPKVTDFGLAKLLHEQEGQTHSGEIVGTPSYMAPEQAVGGRGPIVPATDVYALGSVLYELLSGRPPFQSDTPVDTVLQLIHQEPVPLRALRNVPRDLDTICLKCLQKEPRHRYASAGELAADLQHFLAGEPIQARPTSALRRLAKWVVRHPARAALWSLLAVVASGLLLAGWNWDRNRQQQRGRIELALRETQLNVSEGRWRDAEAAVARSRDLLHAGHGSPAQEAMLRELQRDAAMVRRLEEILLRQTTTDVVRSRFVREAAVPAYREAFRDYGIVAGETPADLAADLVRDRPETVRSLLVASLDAWRAMSRDKAKAEWLRGVISRADPDPWRSRLRQAAEAHDREALRDLVADKSRPAQPPVTLHLLSVVLGDLGLHQEAVAVLRDGQQRYPNDFWLNHDLAWALYQLQPTPLDEVVRYFSIAVALRPENAGAHVNLGTALYERHDLPRAQVEFERAIELEPEYIVAHINRGNALNMQQRHEEGRDSLRRALELDPDNATAHFCIASSLVGLGDYEEALAHVREAISRKPQHAPFHERLAMILLTQKKVDEAIEALREATALKPERADLHYNLGVAYGRAGRLDDAMKSYQRALSLDPSSAQAHANLGAAYLKLDRLDEAEASLKQALRLDRSLEAPRLALALVGERQAARAANDVPHKAEEGDRIAARAALSHAQYLARSGKSQLAIAAYEDLLKRDPDDVDAMVHLAGLYFDVNQDAAAALELLETALQRVPAHWLAWTYRGVVTWSTGDRQQAMEAFRNASQSAPQQPRPYLDWARRLKSLGKIDEAVEVLETGSAAIGNNARLFYELGSCLKDLQRYDDCARALREALQLDPDLADAHVTLGAVLNDYLKRPAEALPHMDRAVQLKPNAVAYHNRGVVRSRMGDLEQAEEDFLAAVKLDKAYVKALYNLGLLYHKQENWEKAAAIYRRATEVQPEYAEAHCNLGHVLMRLDRPEEALPHFERGHEFGSRAAGWPYPSDEWIEKCKRRLEE